jgi:hypothetical protein
MIEREPNESRESYVMRVAAAYLREYSDGETIEYDGTDCDGLCIADDLDAARELMRPANAPRQGCEAYPERGCSASGGKA